nr:uncharacterized protein LOC126526004 [Dermacentor andersoni]
MALNQHDPPMTPTAEHTLFRFGSKLDWRPTCFLEPSPSDRTCNACTLVPRMLINLPCGHRLCCLCYQINVESRNHCPLDKEVFAPQDVTYAAFHDDSLRQYKVRCWNFGNGCGAEGDIISMRDHFNDCLFHAVSCLRCAEKVLQRNIVDHMYSGCVGYSIPHTALQHSNGGIDMREVREALRTITEENERLQAALESFEQQAIAERQALLMGVSTVVARAIDDAARQSSWASSANIHSSVGKIRGVLDRNKCVLKQEYERMMRALKGNVAQTSPGDGKWTRATVGHGRLQASLEAPGGSSGASVEQMTATVQPTVPGNRFRQASVSRPKLETTVNDIAECCECIIENWSFFSSGQEQASICIGRCDCTARQSGFGYILSAELRSSPTAGSLYMKVFAFKSSLGTTTGLPLVKRFLLRFLHPKYAKLDVKACHDVSWLRLGTPWSIVGEQVEYMWSSSALGSVRDLEAGGFIESNKLRMRFKVAPC